MSPTSSYWCEHGNKLLISHTTTYIVCAKASSEKKRGNGKITSCRSEKILPFAVGHSQQQKKKKLCGEEARLDPKPVQTNAL